ncbi:vesicle-associated membrane protein-associated protein B-like [Centruroides vittatus]|uniref:vesicle-associated membrane protein-associated protein B-like n=1 Tax=Centruroides vittatus TaxID=120091 RepID=UPI00350FB4FC
MSSKLEIEPSHLTFTVARNQNQDVNFLFDGKEDDIKLKNNASETVCFKIKTTAPTKYQVSPSYGNVESGETVSIRVKVLSNTYNPLEYIKHKFLVQTMPAPLSGIDHEKMWSEADPAIIREKKLLCVFREVSNSSSSTVTPEESSNVLSVYTCNTTEADINYFKNLRVEMAKLTDGMKDLQMTNEELKVM